MVFFLDYERSVGGKFNFNLIGLSQDQIQILYDALKLYTDKVHADPSDIYAEDELSKEEKYVHGVSVMRELKENHFTHNIRKPLVKE